MLQQRITYRLETNENIENLTKEMQNIKRKQMEIIELKDTIT